MRLFFNKTYLSRIQFLVLFLLVPQGLTAQQEGGDSALVKPDFERGSFLIQEGDVFYESGNYEDAVAAYKKALETLPTSEATKLLRQSLVGRYAQSAAVHARQLSKKGDAAGAVAVVDQALQMEGLAKDPQLVGVMAELMDPIRNNPALTTEHAEDVDQVRRLLYLAQGAYDLGKFDESKRHYENVLRVDEYNTAARRGMERIAAIKTEHFESAKDHRRAEAMMDVEKSWELSPEPSDVTPEFDPYGGQQSQSSFIPVANKLERIIIPNFTLQAATLMEAVDLLRMRAAENDNLAVDPAQKGFNIAVDLDDPSSPETKATLAKTFDLRLTNVPAATILQYITSLTGTTYRSDEYAVRITRFGGVEAGLVTVTYRVPPDFLSNVSAGSQGETETEDIFNTEPSSTGLLAERMGIQEALAEQGISFPSGASASLSPATNTLRVVNTEANQEVIRQIVDSIAQTEPVSVAVRVTMLKIQKDVLEELSFDWLLNPFEFGGIASATGDRIFNLTGGTVGSGNPMGELPNGAPLTDVSNPITAGNRSGEFATIPSSIDGLLRSGATRDTQEFDRAPGVIGFNGTIGNSAIQMLMRGLDQKGGSDLMAQPSVTTRNGQAASITIVEEFIYPTEYEPPEVPDNIQSGGGVVLDEFGVPIASSSSNSVTPVTPANPTAFETRDIGVFLEVLPVADANRQYIDVTLNPIITDFDGFVNFGSPITVPTGGVDTVLTENTILMPVFSVKEINTNVTVSDGSTMVIGGLLKDEVVTIHDKTPLLGDIPVLGRLFQSNVKRQNSTAILFFVNVELLDPTGRPFRDR